MKRKLTVLNVALLALLVAGAFELNRRINQAASRYEILDRLDAPAEAPAIPSPQQPERVRQAEYLSVVNRLLFYPDRNAIVEVEVPVEEVAVRPELPVLTGVMDLGEGPIAMMAATPKDASRQVAVGEKIGEYTFLGFAGEKLKLEWQGGEIEVDQGQLTGQSEVEARASSRPSSGGNFSSDAARRLAARRQAQQAEAKAQARNDTRKQIGGPHNIGAEIRPGAYRADPTDSAPDGAEWQGYRKVVRPTPFGNQSWWVRKDAQSQQQQQR